MITKAIERVCVVCAHPDDVEISCYGTLSRLRERGGQIGVLILTAGEAGVEVNQRHTASAENVRNGIRRQECATALAGLNATVVWGSFPDGAIVCDGRLVGTIDRYLKEFEPDLILSHPQAAPFDHQDHFAASTATLKAWQLLPRHASLWLFEPIVGQRAGWMPNRLIDITEHFEAKLSALAMHKSQAGRAYLSRAWHESRSRTAASAFHSALMGSRRIFEGFQCWDVV